MVKDKFDLSNITGIGSVAKKKLLDAGVSNIYDLLVRNPIELHDVTNMTQESINKYVEAARIYLKEQKIISDDFVSAKDLLGERQKLDRISTGTNCLDTLFQGGVETKALTEVYGLFGSGKTQFCLTLCVMVQQSKENGGLDGKVIYIDTEGTFRPERIEQIAKVRGFDSEKALEGISVVKAHNSAHQLLLLEEIGERVKKDNVKLVVVDSMIGLYRAEYLGRGTLSERQQKITQFVHLLSRMSEVYNFAALATNQVMASPGIMFGDPILAIGGNIVAHTSTYRIYFKKAGKKTIAKMVDSPNHPSNETVFSLGEAGVQDPEEEK
jgi:DNA repair protein RadA